MTSLAGGAAAGTDVRVADVVSAVVVNYNARRYLGDCIRSLRAEGVTEVVVADNASTDRSIVELQRTDPDVLVVETGRNLGYGGAVNRGVARTSTELVLVLNPDAVVEPGTIE